MSEFWMLKLDNTYDDIFSKLYLEAAKYFIPIRLLIKNYSINLGRKNSHRQAALSSGTDLNTKVFSLYQPI